MKLHNTGGLRFGDTTSEVPGTLRFRSGRVEGRLLSEWRHLDYAPSADYISKWGIDGAQISTNYRVGIGTQSPDYPLSVSGNARIQHDGRVVVNTGGTQVTVDVAYISFGWSLILILC